jgi:hypothetical protein
MTKEFYPTVIRIKLEKYSEVVFTLNLIQYLLSFILVQVTYLKISQLYKSGSE